MSIMATLLSALGGSSAAGAATATAGSTAASTSMLGGIMDKAGSAIGSVVDAGKEAVSNIGKGEFDDQIASLEKELATLQEEADFIKTSGGEENMGGYASVEELQKDLQDNDTRSKAVMAELDKLKGKSAASKESGAALKGTLGGGSQVQAPNGSPAVNAGQFDANALTGAAMNGLTGTLGGAPKTTQQQIIQAQHQAFGGFRV